MKLLVIEDDLDDQFFFMEALKEVETSIECSVAENGLEALKILSGNYIPDIIFLDINMPKMNGFDFLKNFPKEMKLKIPVLMTTTSANSSHIEIADELGVKMFIIKPSAISDWATCIKNVINQDLLAINKMEVIKN